MVLAPTPSDHQPAATTNSTSSPTLDAAKEVAFLLGGGVQGMEPKAIEYLALRFCGFSVPESCDLAHIHQKTIHKWRRGPTFSRLEREVHGTAALDFRQAVLSTMWMRNFALTLQHDALILRRVLGLEHHPQTGAVIVASADDRRHVERMSARYTPAQMLVVQQSASSNPDSGFDLTKFVNERLSQPQVSVSTTRTVTVSGQPVGQQPIQIVDASPSVMPPSSPAVVVDSQSVPAEQPTVSPHPAGVVDQSNPSSHTEPVTLENLASRLADALQKNS